MSSRQRTDKAAATHEFPLSQPNTPHAPHQQSPTSRRPRYPSLIFQEEERLGRVFRIVTKEADREDELLFPISALTPPPPPGRSRLPSTWASSLPELRVRAVAAVVPELVSTGALTPQQGATAAGMIRAEDPVVFAACRVAGAAAAAATAAATAATAAAGVAGITGSLASMSVSGGGAAAAAAAAGDGRGRGGGGGRRGWSDEAKGSFASMLKIVLRDRERGVAVGGEARGTSGGLGLGPTEGFGLAQRGGGPAASAVELNGGLWGRAGRLFDGVGAGRGLEEGERESGDLSEAQGSFQADALALADVALVTGKVREKGRAAPRLAAEYPVAFGKSERRLSCTVRLVAATARWASVGFTSDRSVALFLPSVTF